MKKNLLYVALGLMGIMGTLLMGVVSARDCPTGTTYYSSVDGCSQTTPTTSSDGLVYYWTDENGKGVISVKDPDSDNILTMLDKNEGASVAGTTYQSYGYHYQRGNNTPFEMTCTANKSCSNASNFQTDSYSNSPAIYENFWSGHPYSGSKFIQGNTDYWSGNLHYDVLWGGLVGTTTSVYTLWGGIKNGDTRQGPCESGYHVPSILERNALITYWYNTKKPSSKKSLTSLNIVYDGDYTFRADFKLPLAGGRSFSSSLGDQGSHGLYWSSSPDSAGSNYARTLYLYSSLVRASNYDNRAYGYSVRCFKDSYLAPSTYTLELDANGGTLLGADNEGKLIQKVSSGNKAREPIAPTKAGVIFQSWVYANDEATTFDFSTDIVNSNIQLKVKWAIQYTITFDYTTNQGTSATTGSVKVISGDTLDLSQYTGTKADREFIGWNTDSGATTGMANPTITAPITLYAIFKKNLTATFTSNNANIAGSQTSGACTLYNTDTSCSITLPSITCDTGYHTPVWAPDNLDNITADTGATASCTVKEHKLNFVVDDKVIQSGDVAYGTDISSPANPNKECNSFAGWTSNVEGLTTTGTMPDSDVTFTANWNYTCSRSSGGCGRSRSTTANTQDSSTSSQNDEKTPDSSEKTQNDKNTENVIQSETKGSEESSNTPMDSSANASEGQYSEEFQKAYTFAKEKSITTMDTIEDANMEKPLTRIAMAKMLSYYAINVLNKKPDTDRINKFSDVSDELDAEYDHGVTLAYQLGIMGINMKNNKFRPNDLVTRAEFATALSRLLFDTPDGEDVYYSTHLEKLLEEKIITNDDPNLQELRGYVMIMLMRSAED